MRKIGQLKNEEQARIFADYLLIHDIPHQIEAENTASDASPWAVWVLDEEQVESSRALLSRYRSMPDAEEFEVARKEAARRRQTAKSAPPNRAEIVNIPIPENQFGPVTLILIGLCTLVALLTQLGQNGDWMAYLRISNSPLPPRDPWHFWQSLTLVAQGQIWRLFTPVFLHFSIIHLLFNMLWLRDLGTLLEHKLGSLHLILLITGIALISNLCQYIFAGGNFGGMSGVVYGLFGYLLARGKAEPAFGTWISPFTTGMLLIFLALGIFGLFGPIANAAHFSGLISGGILGYATGMHKHRAR